MERVKKTIDYLIDMFNNSEYLNNHPEEKRYRLEHTFRVANIGKIIAEREGFDLEAMVIACLLHDISYIYEFKTEEEWKNHGRTSARLIRSFVESLKFPKETENDILFGIAIHVDGEADFLGVKTPFAECISDADNIDRFDVYRIYETLKYAKYDELPSDKQREFCMNRISGLVRLLSQTYGTKTSTALFHEKLMFQKQFFERLLAQLDNSLETKL